MKLKNPEIEKHLVVSLAHISGKDRNILENAYYHPISNAGMVLSIDKFEYGYRIFVGTEEHKSDALIKNYDLAMLGLSIEFINLIIITYELGCKFLCLDVDGKIYNELKTFDEED